MKTSKQFLNGNMAVGLLTMFFVAATEAHDSAPAIAAINSTPEGQSYGRWAAEWWQWALGIPAASNPITDQTGTYCGQRQVDKVWFLAGSAGGDPINRSCAVPAGKSLFFPMINTFYGAFLNDTAETRTDDFVRSQATCLIPAKISVWIDGYRVSKAQRYFTGASGSASPLFNVQLPPENLFGIDTSAADEIALSPSAEQGYYLFVRPLKPGTHTIRWTARGCTDGGAQDITYQLMVEGNEPGDN